MLFPSRRDPPRGYPGLELLRLGVGVGDHEVSWRGEEGLSARDDNPITLDHLWETLG